MAVPAFNDYLLPVLKHTGDGAEHTVSELTEAMAEHFLLKPEDLAEILPSGARSRGTRTASTGRALTLPRLAYSMR